MNKGIRIGTGAVLVGGGVIGFIGILMTINLSTILNSFPGFDLWVYLISNLVGMLLFLWSSAVGIALIRNFPNSPFWAAILMLFQTPYIQSSNFIFEFGSGFILRITLAGFAILFGGHYQVGVPNGDIAFNIGVNVFSLVMFVYLLRVNHVEEVVFTDVNRDRPNSYKVPLGSSRTLIALLRPRNIAIFSLVAVVFITGAVLLSNAVVTSERAAHWVQATFPALARNWEDTTVKYGALKHFDAPACTKGVSIIYGTMSFGIQTRCTVKATFDQADVVVMMVLMEKGNSWEIREVTLGTVIPPKSNPAQK